MNGQCIFLDDIRSPWTTTHVKIPRHPYTIVRTYEEFVRAVEGHYEFIGEAPKFVSFDYDLDMEHYNPDYKGDYKEKTGLDCAKFLIEFCEEKKLDFPEYIVHSMNPVGTKNIISLIESYKRSEKT